MDLHDLVLGVLEDSLEGTFGGLLDGGLDLVVRGTLLEPDDQVDDRDVGGGDSEGHPGQLSVEAGDDLADGLGGTGRGGDDVGTGSSSTTPWEVAKGKREQVVSEQATVSRPKAGRSNSQSLLEGPSTVFWVAVVA